MSSVSGLGLEEKLPEAILLQKAQAGDSDALGGLLLRHQSACHSLALKLIADEAEARNVCQEAFLRAFRTWDLWTPKKPFQLWLLRFVCESYQTRANAAARKSAQKTPLREDERPTPVDEAKTRCAVETRTDLRSLLADKLATMNAAKSLPLRLHYNLGYRHEDTAVILGIPATDVARRIRAGLGNLRAKLACNGFSCASTELAEILKEGGATALTDRYVPFIKNLAASHRGKLPALVGAKARIRKGLRFLRANLAAILIIEIALVGLYRFWPPPKRMPPQPVAGEKVRIYDPQKFYVFTDKVGAHGIFYDLWSRGLRVYHFPKQRSLLIPPELRYQQVEGRRFIDEAAKYNGLSVVWCQNGLTAVIQKNSPDVEIEEIIAGAQSSDWETRLDTAWQLAYCRDVRSFDAWILLAEDSNKDVVEQVVQSLKKKSINSSFTEILAGVCGERAWPLLSLLSDRNDPDFSAHQNFWRRKGFYGLMRTDGDKALAMIDKELESESPEFRGLAADALFSICGRKISLWSNTLTYESILSTPSDELTYLRQALGENVFPLYEKALKSSCDKVAVRAKDVTACLRDFFRWHFEDRPGNRLPFSTASREEERLYYFSCEKRWQCESMSKLENNPALEAAFKDPMTFLTLYRQGDDRALDFVEKALHHEEAKVRVEAAMTLAGFGGDRALDLLFRAASDDDETVRSAAGEAFSRHYRKHLPILKKQFDQQKKLPYKMHGLGNEDDDGYMEFLEEISGDPSPSKQQYVAMALSVVGGYKVLAIVEKMLQSEHEQISANAMMIYCRMIPSSCKVRRVLSVLETALKCRHYEVFKDATYKLARDYDVDRAVKILLKTLQVEKDARHVECLVVLINQNYSAHPDVKESLDPNLKLWRERKEREEREWREKHNFRREYVPALQKPTFDTDELF
jgi:RNA polymerase sigma-70 factor (ECF subfamily)